MDMKVIFSKIVVVVVFEETHRKNAIHVHFVLQVLKQNPPCFVLSLSSIGDSIRDQMQNSFSFRDNCERVKSLYFFTAVMILQESETPTDSDFLPVKYERIDLSIRSLSWFLVLHALSGISHSRLERSSSSVFLLPLKSILIKWTPGSHELDRQETRDTKSGYKTTGASISDKRRRNLINCVERCDHKNARVTFVSRHDVVKDRLPGKERSS
jgi:hypothetical protein